MLLEQKLGFPSEVVCKYLISLPTEEAHHKCHPTKEAIQLIHPELIAKIQKLVSAGVTEPVEVWCLLRHHVCHYSYMCTSKQPNPKDEADHHTIDNVRITISGQRRLFSCL